MAKEIYFLSIKWILFTFYIDVIDHFFFFEIEIFAPENE